LKDSEDFSRRSGKKHRTHKWREKIKFQLLNRDKKLLSNPDFSSIKRTPLPQRSVLATILGLNWLKERGVFSFIHQALPGTRYKPGELDGIIGADFIPFLPSGDAKPFQLKSTFKKGIRDRKRIINRHLKKHSHIRYIIVLGPEDIPDSENDITMIIHVAKVIFQTLFPGNDFEKYFRT